MKLPVLETGTEPLLPKLPKHEVQSMSGRKKLHRSKTAPGPIVNSSSGSSPKARDNTTRKFHFPFQVTNNSTVTQASLIAAAYIGVGMICFVSLNHELKGEKTKSAVDALYFCIVTMTTVGYGDLVPGGVISKLLVCAYVFTGVTLMGVFLTGAADYLVEKQEKILMKAVNAQSQSCNEVDELTNHDGAKNTRGKICASMIILTSLFLLGIAVLKFFEGLDLLDSFYAACCTITTLGFGDVSFKTEVGRIFAVFWIPVSAICVGHFILHLAEIKAAERQKGLVEWVMKRQTTASDLEAGDMDSDGALSPAEFIVYKLKEMGKIEEEDIVLIMKEFENLDADGSGKVTKSDLNAVQEMKNRDVSV